MQLEKSLYGLAQRPGNWFHTIDPVLVDIGFVPLKSDTCVYVYNRECVKIILHSTLTTSSRPVTTRRPWR